MKKFIYLITTSLFLLSCQIEEDDTPTPQDSFIKYYGELTSYEASDIEIVYDEGNNPEYLVILGTKLTSNGDKDLFVLLTDLDGGIVDSISFGFQSLPIDLAQSIDSTIFFDDNQDGSVDSEDLIRGDETAGQIESVGDQLYVVGTSVINTPDLVDLRVLLTVNVEIREVLGQTGLIPRGGRSLSAGNALDLIGNDIILLEEGSLLIGGSIEVDRGGQNDFDSYFTKLDLELEQSLEGLNGVAGIGENESAVRVFEKAGGNLVLIGFGNTTSSLGENDTGNGPDNGINAYYLELDPNGTPINSRYFGVDDTTNNQVYNELVTSAINVSGGYVLSGTSTTSQNEQYGFMINLSNDGIYLSGNSLRSVDFQEGLETEVNGLTQTIDSDFIVVGQYLSFNLGDQSTSKSGEALFMKVDQSSNPVPDNESNFGLTDGTDEFVDAVTLPDGSIMVAGNIDFGAGTQLISIIKLFDTGSLVD